jgi:hypothetical protein
VERPGASRANGFHRLRRLPFVVLLTLGLLVSLIHCAGCGLAFASSGAATIALNIDTGSLPEIPDQQLPAHSGHCLSHVTAQNAIALVLPADFQARAQRVGRETFPPTFAGLAPFKPPRA